MCLICMHCGKCPGVELNPDATGSGNRTLYCLKCGEEVPVGAVFCPGCGTAALVPPGLSMREAQ
ncbi:MAG: zinc-ribbon domain-containing protein [Bacteroidales bacterium]